MSEQKYCFTIQLAATPIEIEARYPATKNFCRDYLTDATAVARVKLPQEKLDWEKAYLTRQNQSVGLGAKTYPDAYLETWAAYRATTMALVQQNAFVMLGAAVAVDGLGYLVIAKKGTGQNTHASLARQLFGPDALMLSEEKPILKLTQEGILVYGSPWDGRGHGAGAAGVPLSGVCMLMRDAANGIERVPRTQSYPLLVPQTYHPTDPQSMAKTLSMVDTLASAVPLYRMSCNMTPEAMRMACEMMR